MSERRSAWRERQGLPYTAAVVGAEEGNFDYICRCKVLGMGRVGVCRYGDWRDYMSIGMDMDMDMDGGEVIIRSMKSV